MRNEFHHLRFIFVNDFQNSNFIKMSDILDLKLDKQLFIIYIRSKRNFIKRFVRFIFYYLWVLDYLITG